MTKHTGNKEFDSTLEGKGLNRREFFKAGAAAGVGAAALAGTTVAAQAETNSGRQDIQWDYVYDVVVLGGGCFGLPGAIRARDLGASVLVIDQNFDFGGRMAHSGGQISLGGGDPAQLRDIAGEADLEGFITVPAQHTVEELTEDVDYLWRDMTDWSIVDGAAQAPYRYNERDLHRAWADNCFDTRNFLTANYVRMGRIAGTHGNGGMTRARRAVSFWMLGESTDVHAGTITPADAGWDAAGENMIETTSQYAPARMGSASEVVGPGAVGAGSALARAMEFSAREKGVVFMANRHMDEIIRESQFDGRILGVKASYTPRFDPETGLRLESYWQNGSIDETRDVIYIKAQKGVLVATGGHAGNPSFRSSFYPAMREPAFGTSGQSLLGRGRGQDGSGIIAGLKVGAALAGLQQNLSYPATYHVGNRIGTPDAYTDMYPGHPTFNQRGSVGFSMNANAMEHAIAVNQVGKRFYNDMDFQRRHPGANFPGGSTTPAEGVDIVQLDWRNSSRDFIRGMYARHAGMDAALAINEGSKGPEFLSGPLWIIFDQGTVERAGLDLRWPFVSDNGYFFQADTIEELASMVQTAPFMTGPMTYLQETIDRWNGFVDAGEDSDFGRGPDAPMHKIETPSFYAASAQVIWHDSYGGLRINGKCQVLDWNHQPIPGLYAGCESSGGGNQHGLGRGVVHGYIAGTNVVNTPAL